MKLFKSFTLRWWQGSLFKISMVAFGLALGATWPGFFAPWSPALWLLFVVPGIYVGWVWWKQ